MLHFHTLRWVTPPFLQKTVVYSLKKKRVSDLGVLNAEGGGELQ